MAKQAVIKLRSLRSRWRLDGATVVMVALIGGIVIQGLAAGGHPLPPSPPPCSPDGFCYPKVDSWGYNKTRWRAWPGEDPAVVPTPVDELVPEEPPLPPFDRPEPRDEDRRGPARPVPVVRGLLQDPTGPVDPAVPFDPAVPDQPPLDGVPAVPFGEEPAQPFQEPQIGPAQDDFFPDFNQQGQMGPRSDSDDSPPALPSGLRAALQTKSTRQHSQSATHHAAPHGEALIRTTGPAVSLPAVAANAKLGGPTDLKHLGWDQTGASSIRLVNPAAADIVYSEDAEEQLQQALYIEASDQD